MKAIKSPCRNLMLCFLKLGDVMGALVHNSFISVCPHRCFHSPVHSIPFPSMLPLLSLSLSLAPLLFSVIIISISLYLPLSICPFLWNKTWIHYSFIQTYLSSPHAALCPLSARVFLIVLQLFTTRTVPSENRTTLGSVILAVQALTRVVREAVKIPLGDSPVITIAVPA